MIINAINNLTEVIEITYVVYIDLDDNVMAIPVKNPDS